uniref:Uncharacterized protein n=1 Tax=Panagrolaimus sp. ES5 TaxID=591445 RepID=A0AC34GPF8_9BILA
MDLLDEEIEREAASTSRQSNHHDNDSDFMNREATEVEILMNHKVRISRTRRMNWYLDFHDCYIRLAESDTTGKKPFQVGGVVLKDGDKLDANEEFKISSATTCLFFSKYYKMSFILDFSPSVFVADGVGDILYTNMMPCVEKMLKELVYQFKFSNSKNTHKAEIYVTLIAYSPLIHFRKPPILVHGFRVTDTTIEDFLTLANANAKAYLNDLLEYMLPINLQKEKNQIKISKRIGESRRIKGARFRAAKPSESEVSTPGDEEAAEDGEEVQPSTINDKIAIDFRLIQMLRLGMLGLFSAPETSQPGIVIITDGILYIPNQEVIQSIALNLRTNCIPLHFIEITSAGCGASPGYIPSSDLLSFLAQVSYGNHIRHKELLSYEPSNEFINKFQRIMLSWSCQRGTYEMEAPLSSCANHPGRIRKQISRIKSNFYQLFHVRIREGYFLKSLNVIKKGSKDYISALLTFPWTFDCRIDYQISAVYNDCDERIHDVHRVVTIETNYAPPDPITDPRDSALTAALFLSEAEKFAIKILSFSAISDNYEVAHIPFHRYPSLYGFTQESFPFPTLIIKQLEKTKFNGFWEPLVLADNAALHRCSHTLSMRFTTDFAENQKPSTNFWPEFEGEGDEAGQQQNPTDFPAKNYLLNTLFDYFKATTTFCLVARYCYVKIVREGLKSPEYCYLVKIFADSTLLTIKVIFVGDCSLDVRNKTVGKIRNDLMKNDKVG